MYLLYVITIYFLALLKISYEVLISLAIILSIMAAIRYLTNDKAVFSKNIEKFRRYIYGEL